MPNPAQTIELGGVMPRDQAAIDVVFAARLRDVRDKKRQFEAATKAELDSNLEKWRALGAKRKRTL